MSCSKIHIPSRIDKRNAEKEGRGTKIYENQHKKEDESNRKDWIRLRAENETRTRDPNLGKVVLYQLSYFRKCEEEETRTPTSQLTLPPQSSASTNSATSPLHIRSTCFFIGEGVFRCGLSLWHRACFPFAIAKVRHLPQLTKFTRKKNAFSAVFLPLCLQKWGLCAETRGFFAERRGIFPAASHLSPFSCVRRAQSTRRCRVCSLAAQSACPTRPCPSRAIAVGWVQRPKKAISHFLLRRSERWPLVVASTTAQF